MFQQDKSKAAFCPFPPDGAQKLRRAFLAVPQFSQIDLEGVLPQAKRHGLGAMLISESTYEAYPCKQRQGQYATHIGTSRTGGNEPMFRLDNWFLTCGFNIDGSCVEFAHGNAFGNPRFVNGGFIRTSWIISFALSEDALTVETINGSTYVMRFSEFNAAEERDMAAYEKVGIDETLMEKILAMSEKRNEEICRMYDGLLGENELYLELVGSASIDLAWFKDGDGVVYKIKPLCNLSMRQDSWLIRERGVVDFRLFPKGAYWEPYHVSDNIERILFRNLDSQSTSLRVHGSTYVLKGEAVTTVEKSALAGVEGLFSPDCFNGKSLFFGRGEDKS